MRPTPRQRATQQAMKRQPRTTKRWIRRGPPHRKARLPNGEQNSHSLTKRQRLIVFAWWGRTVYRYRIAVVAVMVALCLGSGIYGSSLGEHVTQSGFFDDNSESAQASRLGNEHYGRDTSGHIVAIYTAPDGKTVDDPAFRKKILDNLAQVEKDHPDQIIRSIGYFKTPVVLKNMADPSKQRAFMSIQLKGDNDDLILKNFKAELQARSVTDPGRRRAARRTVAVGQRADRAPSPRTSSGRRCSPCRCSCASCCSSCLAAWSRRPYPASSAG